MQRGNVNYTYYIYCIEERKKKKHVKRKAKHDDKKTSLQEIMKKSENQPCNKNKIKTGEPC